MDERSTCPCACPCACPPASRANAPISPVGLPLSLPLPCPEAGVHASCPVGRGMRMRMGRFSSRPASTRAGCVPSSELVGGRSGGGGRGRGRGRGLQSDGWSPPTPTPPPERGPTKARGRTPRNDLFGRRRARQPSWLCALFRAGGWSLGRRRGRGRGRGLQSDGLVPRELPDGQGHAHAQGQVETSPVPPNLPPPEHLQVGVRPTFDRIAPQLAVVGRDHLEEELVDLRHRASRLLRRR